MLKKKLRGARDCAPRRKLVTFQPCDDWLFQAIYEKLVDGREASERDDFVTPLRQTVGVRGFTRDVAYKFHIINGGAAADFLNVGPDEARSAGHVILRDIQPATALGIITTITFKRRGPRDEPDTMTLTITASVGLGADVADRNNGEPDWRFDDSEEPEDTDAARLFISRALLEMQLRTPGILSAGMLVGAQQDGQ
eukprot:3528037-Prymnesium_polylepis.2